MPEATTVSVNSTVVVIKSTETIGPRGPRGEDSTVPGPQGDPGPAGNPVVAIVSALIFGGK